MTRLALPLADRIRRDLPDFDAQVATTPDVDRFCSSTPWIGAAFDAFHADMEPVTVRAGNTSIAMARGTSVGVGTYLMPGEGVWALAAPAAGPDGLENAHRLFEFLADGGHGARVAMLTGWSEGSPTFERLVRLVVQGHRARLVEPVTRYIASLDGGVDGFLSRRRRKFRANLRRIERHAIAEGFAFTTVRPSDQATLAAAYERALQIEQRSWKTAAGNGVAEGPMRTFTGGVLARGLDAGDQPCFVFASLDGADVGYLHGLRRGDYFRGLQMSFDDRFRDRSPGNLLQWTAIRELAEAGARAYDLGSSVPYKQHWAEQEHTTTGLLMVVAA